MLYKGVYLMSWAVPGACAAQQGVCHMAGATELQRVVQPDWSGAALPATLQVHRMAL